MSESGIRERIALLGKSLFDRGLTMGSSGNISVKLDDGWLMTSTNASLGRLDPGALSKLDPEGRSLRRDLSPPQERKVAPIPETGMPELTAAPPYLAGSLNHIRPQLGTKKVGTKKIPANDRTL